MKVLVITDGSERANAWRDRTDVLHVVVGSEDFPHDTLMLAERATELFREVTEILAAGEVTVVLAVGHVSPYGALAARVCAVPYVWAAPPDARSVDKRIVDHNDLSSALIPIGPEDTMLRAVAKVLPTVPVTTELRRLPRIVEVWLAVPDLGFRRMELASAGRANIHATAEWRVGGVVAWLTAPLRRVAGLLRR
ncbi:hypothetical protein GCM10022198_10000 [Klugiella xanthotipulae]|uniref:Uncharacterized protein n=1 Tax=Klugiella xanthotipulae TaxID=244735 RepID=A0A543HYK5_9MICO|nr:hypothetical protein [Klugiella xanthotipulae]TQM63398.1 hypothetical protein FB466_1660 [Klugiella xanthotipulae]